MKSSKSNKNVCAAALRFVLAYWFGGLFASAGWSAPPGLVRPISSRKRTDLDAVCDRSRRGVRPISSRKWTDLGGFGARVRSHPARPLASSASISTLRHPARPLASCAVRVLRIVLHLPISQRDRCDPPRSVCALRRPPADMLGI